MGKSFDVDDGFLKKIRVAQFQPGRTRGGARSDDDLSDYDAFLLPNPYRLIIDIHGKNEDKAKNARVRESKAPPESGAGGTEPAQNEDSQEVTSKIESKKEDLRAKAGKPPVNRQDVGDDVTVTLKSGIRRARKPHRRPAALKPRWQRQTVVR